MPNKYQLQFNNTGADASLVAFSGGAFSPFLAPETDLRVSGAGDILEAAAWTPGGNGTNTGSTHTLTDASVNSLAGVEQVVVLTGAFRNTANGNACGGAALLFGSGSGATARGIQIHLYNFGPGGMRVLNSLVEGFIDMQQQAGFTPTQMNGTANGNFFVAVRGQALSSTHIRVEVYECVSDPATGAITATLGWVGDRSEVPDLTNGRPGAGLSGSWSDVPNGNGAGLTAVGFSDTLANALDPRVGASNAPGGGTAPTTPGTKTTAAAGSFANNSTWVGGVLPIAGDNIVISHAVTISASTLALGTIRITPAGRLTVTAGTVSCLDLKWEGPGSSTNTDMVTLTSTGTVPTKVQFRVAAAAVVFMSSSSTADGQRARVKIAGASAANPVIVEAVNGGKFSFAPSTTSDDVALSNSFNGSNFILRNLDKFVINCGVGGAEFRTLNRADFDSFRFITTGGFRGGGTDIDLQGFKTLNPFGESIVRLGGAYSPNTGGVQRLQNFSISGNVELFVKDDWNPTDGVIYGSITQVLGEGARPSLWTDVLFVHKNLSGNSPWVLYDNTVRCGVISESSDNPHPTMTTDFKSTIHDELVFGNSAQFAGNTTTGDLVQQGGNTPASGMMTTTFNRMIKMASDNLASIGTICTNPSGPTYRSSFKKCTFFIGGDDGPEMGGMRQGEGRASGVGLDTAVDCIFFDTTARSRAGYNNDDGNPANTVNNALHYHHNAYFRVLRPIITQIDGSPVDIDATSIELTAQPFDNLGAATLKAFDAYVGGPGTSLNAVAQLVARTNAAYTLTNLRAYLYAVAMKPSAAAVTEMQGKATDGGIMGAASANAAPPSGGGVTPTQPTVTNITASPTTGEGAPGTTQDYIFTARAENGDAVSGVALSITRVSGNSTLTVLAGNVGRVTRATTSGSTIIRAADNVSGASVQVSDATIVQQSSGGYVQNSLLSFGTLPVRSTRAVSFFLVTSTGNPATGRTPTVMLSRNGGAFVQALGTVTEIGGGWYAYRPTVEDTGTPGALALEVGTTDTGKLRIVLNVQDSSSTGGGATAEDVVARLLLEPSIRALLATVNGYRLDVVTQANGVAKLSVYDIDRTTLLYERELTATAVVGLIEIQ